MPEMTPELKARLRAEIEQYLDISQPLRDDDLTVERFVLLYPQYSDSTARTKLNALVDQGAYEVIDALSSNGRRIQAYRRVDRQE